MSYKFEVSNINDERVAVSKGTMEISRSQLILTTYGSPRRKTTWPLKHLRRLGCSGNTFCFEAGRKCSLGEGLYAFQCSRASELLQVVQVMLRSIESDQSVPTTGPFHTKLKHQYSFPPVLSRDAKERAKTYYRCRHASLCQDDEYDVVWDISKMQQINKPASADTSLPSSL